jgi:hypothetical protein
VLLFLDRWLKYCRNKTISRLLKYRGSVDVISGRWWKEATGDGVNLSSKVIVEEGYPR